MDYKINYSKCSFAAIRVGSVNKVEQRLGLVNVREEHSFNETIVCETCATFW